ncbi:arginine--tRNA ligase [Roseibacillus ishigakijimensis]|uniref:Arginine--tRNA ligase n=1 Tax=Roseibacillus ishigakijimensis TaxID=454146 RepID=A0A934RSJ8_9BACT|nr:arginine--tRNA ligase [Roseibacillus ishigakijimensis]MBK1834264.1 arginine--tRNA ligase [Roseibacillus ishigakijimensis]
MTLAETLRGLLTDSFAKAGIEGADLARVAVVAASDIRHGDYQSNAAMMLAKAAKKNPRALAEEVLTHLEPALAGKAEVSLAGPGFINFKLAPAFFAEQVRVLFGDDRLGVPMVGDRKRIVVDFSAPNVAKPMHVGHIRSTVIGESLARVATFLGHEVIKDNHIGDWGTQFGMVLWAWKKELDEKALEEEPLRELLRLYRLGSSSSKAEEAIADECRAELVKLQQGDAENTAIWQRCIELSKKGLNAIYDRLDVSFDYWLGESFYNDRLAPLVEEMVSSGMARESEGAICVFSDGELPPKKDPFLKTTKEGVEDYPFLIRKRDGGFNYATTDIATIDYRLAEWEAEVIWYVVDFRQEEHFTRLFHVARRRGCQAELAHVKFGTILGKDGTPLKTRAGDLPQLEDVINDAVAAARKSVAEKSFLEDEQEKEELAELIGVSAIKFMELSHRRESDYTYDLEKMVALEGDTAPYLQYSYVRCRSIFRKLEEEVALAGEDFVLADEREIHLARTLAKYGEVVPQVLEDLRPNILASYLLDLARAYHSFFQSCPVLKSEGATKASRLTLCEVTARVLQSGLALLGIGVPEKM